MSNFVRIASRSSTIGIALPLAALLSMSVSHTAMAACTESSGVVTCAGPGTMPGIEASNAATSITVNSNATVQVFQFTELPANLRYGAIIAPQTNSFAEPYGSTTHTVEGTDAHGEDVDVVVGPGITITNNGAINNANAGVAPLATSRTSYGIHFDGSDNTIVNNGTISLSTGTVLNNNNGTMYGIYTSVAGGENYYDNNHIINNGTIEVTRQTNNSTGTARAIYFGEQQLGMIVDNSATGTIRATRLGTPTATSTNIVAGIDTDDTPGTLTVNNKGTIEVTGAKTAAIYGRSSQTVINNEGTIRNNTWTAADGKNDGHYAIGSYAGSSLVADPASLDPENPQPLLTGGRAEIDDASQLTLTNAATGMIIGDVLAVDANPLTVAAAGSLSATNLNTRNSVIDNEGTINGNIYLGSGNHEVTNEHIITQNIIVDQSDGNGAFAQPPGSPGCANPAPAACTLPAVVHGDRVFSFENSDTGTLGIGVTGGAANAKIQITDYADSVNDITLHGTGFVGSVIAMNGTGDNTLTLDGVTNLNSVQKFRTLDLMNSSVTVSNGVSLVDGATILTEIYGAGGTSAAPSTALGEINGKLTLLGSSTVSTTISSTVHDGDVYRLATAAVAAGPIDVESNSALVDFTATASLVDGLRLEAEVKDASEVSGISQPGAAAINALIDASDTDPKLGALAAGVEALPDDASVAKAGAQLAPETNFATQQTAITLNNAVGQHIDTRLASAGGTPSLAPVALAPSGLGMRPADSGRSNLGANYYDEPEFVAPRSGALWGKGFGAGLDQERREFVDGYNARLYGLLVGYDNWVSPGFRVGVAGGFANTTIDGSGDTRQNQTGIDSYLGEAYAALKGSGWYATGRTGFTWHNYDTTRVLTVPFKDTATATHEGHQYNAAIEFGAPMRMSGAVLTPIASLTYSHLDQDGYTEKSNAGMALNVASQSNDSVVSGLGLKALVPIANDTVIEGRAVWLHEFSDTSQVVTASFAAGGGTFTAAGPNVGRDSAALGAGILAQVDQNMTFELNYDANVRQDFLAHIGSAKLNVNF